MTVTLHTTSVNPEGRRPVVLIHGWPLSGASWEKQVPALADAGFHVVTYDRRGFGQSDKSATAYDYDALADDLSDLLEKHDLRDATLVGFSMGGGEVARYIARHGEDRLHSVVFAAAVPPYLRKTEDNPDGPLPPEVAAGLEAGLRADRTGFFAEFAKGFFGVNGKVVVSDADMEKALAMCHQSDQAAALGCMAAWATTDFREDLTKITVPTLILHGDSDATVPVEGSGARTHAAVAGSEIVIIPDAPHGFNTTHPEAFNKGLLAFLER